MVKLRLRRRSPATFQVWRRAGDGRWSPIGAPRESFHEAARLARLLQHGGEVAVVPVSSRPIASS